VPIALYGADKDEIATPASVEWLQNELRGNETDSVLQSVMIVSGNHTSILDGISGSYRDQVIGHLRKFNPLPAPVS